MHPTNNKLFKLSPSDFKYLWEDCKHCFYQKVVNGISPPSMPFPGIFTKMNGQMQAMALGKTTTELIDNLTPGTFYRQEGFLKSSPVPSKNTCYITGRYDVLTKFDNGEFGIIDLKITDPKDTSLYKFSSQLHAYKFASENPSEGKPLKINRLGLLIIAPQEVQFHKGYVFFRSKPIYKEIDIDMDAFLTFIDEIAIFLSGKCPQPSVACGYCKYRATEMIY